MDVSKPTVPACPLPIADPTLSEANHPATIGIDAIAEVEVLYLYLMLASHNSTNDVLVLTDGGKGRIVLDPTQHVGYTGLDHRVPPMVRASGCSTTAGAISLSDTLIIQYCIVLVYRLW